MAVDASGVLGSRQVAGVKVNPPGLAWRQASMQGGGLAAGIMRSDVPQPGQPVTPSFGRLAYLAVTDQEIALVRLRARKAVLLEAAEVIARAPRSQLQTAELVPGYVAPLTVIFTDGGAWQLEVPPPGKRHASAVVHALGGRVLSRKDMPSQGRPRMSGSRILRGLILAVLAAITGAGGVAELTIANIGGAVVCFLIAVPAAWYAYRTWTRKTRRPFLIV